MSKTAKIAISLPEDLLQVLEAWRKACGQTRSEFFRQAVEAFLRREQERELDEQYVRGYLETPETDEEAAWVQAVGITSLAGEPWDKEEGR